MKKNKCPYLDSQNRCTHKLPAVERRSNKGLPDCIFNNENKCPLHNEWFNQLKATRELNKAPEGYIKRVLEQYKQRWLK